MSELFDEQAEPQVEVARYRYRSANGRLLFWKTRYGPRKDFRLYRFNDQGEAVSGLGDVERVLYHLPAVKAAIAESRRIWVVEGEKDADNLENLGEVATCNFDGASKSGQKPKWRHEYADMLAGAAEIIVVADRDEAGYAHARAILESLTGRVASLRIVQAAVEKPGADASDHLDAGFGLDQFLLVPAEGIADIAARIRKGGCILDAPKVPEAVWGRGEDILWAQGQSLIIAGHDGTGKTTLAGNLIRGRLGLGTGRVLGLPVREGKRNVLVLMMDRPQQAMSSLARLFSEDDRLILDDRLRIWTGPPPQDLAMNTALLAELCRLADADTCIVDSLKDAAIPLTDDAVGAGWNRARQAAIVAGVELLELHHPRKPMQQDAAKPPELADLYGSRWIPAGIGTAIVLHGRAGEPYVKMFQRKAAISLLGPWDLLISESGEVTVDQDQADLVRRIARRGKNGITVAEAALMLYGSDTRNEIERARRMLEKVAREGHLSRQGDPKSNAVVYKISSANLYGDVTQ